MSAKSEWSKPSLPKLSAVAGERRFVGTSAWSHYFRDTVVGLSSTAGTCHEAGSCSAHRALSARLLDASDAGRWSGFDWRPHERVAVENLLRTRERGLRASVHQGFDDVRHRCLCAVRCADFPPDLSCASEREIN